MKKKFLIAAAAVTATLMMAVPSLANVPKTSYSYSFGTGGYQYTAARVKDWQSASIMDCNSCVNTASGVPSYGSYDAVVLGSSSEKGTFTNPVNKAGNGSPTYRFFAGDSIQMTNYVYTVYKVEQSGVKNAWTKIRGTLSAGGYITFNGKWAPDI